MPVFLVDFLKNVATGKFYFILFLENFKLHVCPPHVWLHHMLSQQAPAVGDGQGSLAGCSAWGRKELDTTERLS